MIDLSQKFIASLLLCSVTCGLFLGVAYDAVRFLRCFLSPTVKKSAVGRTVTVVIVTFLTDLTYLLLFAVCGILITFEMCGGVFRGIVYVGLAVGILTYRISLGRLTARAAEWLARIAKQILLSVARILFLPLRIVNFLIVKLYILTIGKIIGRIKERILIKRLAGVFAKKKATGDEPLPPSDEPCEKGYKKEGRVSFGEKKVH